MARIPVDFAYAPGIRTIKRNDGVSLLCVPSLSFFVLHFHSIPSLWYTCSSCSNSEGKERKKGEESKLIYHCIPK